MTVCQVKLVTIAPKASLAERSESASSRPPSEGGGGLRAPRGKKSPASCESEAGSSLRLWIRAPARVSQILNHRRTSTKLGSSAVSSSNNAPRKYSTATASARTQWVGAPVCCVATGTIWSEGGRGRERRQKSATRRRPAVGILWGSYGDPVGIRSYFKGSWLSVLLPGPHETQGILSEHCTLV